MAPGFLHVRAFGIASADQDGRQVSGGHPAWCVAQEDGGVLGRVDRGGAAHVVVGDVQRNHWVDPDVGAVNFEFVRREMGRRTRALPPPRTSCTAACCGCTSCPPSVAWTWTRSPPRRFVPGGLNGWRPTGATTVAKSYRLLKAIMETAVDDELIRRNPCRIKGAGNEQAKRALDGAVEQVDALAEAMGPRWRLMVYFGAYGPMRPEEQAALRRTATSRWPRWQ